MFKIIAFCVVTLFARLHASVGIFLACEKHLQDRISSLLTNIFGYQFLFTFSMFFFYIYRETTNTKVWSDWGSNPRSTTLEASTLFLF